MNSFRIGHTATVAALALASAFVGGCGGPSEADSIASAKALLEKKDTSAAVIQLKSALQANPQSGEARLLLGRALLESGNVAPALIELERAHDLKVADDLLLPWLAKAMLANGKAKSMVDLYGNVTLASPKAAAELKATVAAAYVGLGQWQKCEATLKSALALDPKNTAARLQMARLAAGHNADDALTQVDALLADEPRLREAWLLKAELMWFSKNDIDGAKKAFEQALAADPKYQEAHSALATLLFQQRDIPGFKARVAEMHKQLPDRLETRYYQAQLALVENDYRSARSLLQPMLKALPKNVRVLQLASALELVDGSPLMAETYLKRALEVAPRMTTPRRLLAQTLLRTGEPDKALAVLRPLVEIDQPRSEDLALTAEAHLHGGDVGRAEEYFRRAAKLNPESVNVNTALALTEISRGNAEAGFADLESIASRDRSSSYADVALISARLLRNQLDEALKAVDNLETKMPGDVLPHYLRAKLLAQRGDRAASRKSFDRVLAIDPNYFPAISALASLDLADRKPQDARERYAAMLKRDPKNPRAMVALAQLMNSTGAPAAEVADLLEKAVQAAPEDAATRVAQIEFFLAKGDQKAANAAAQAGSAALPDDFAMLEAVGRVQLAGGNTQQAIAAFGKAAAAQPGSTRAQLRLADAYLAVKDFDNATKTLNHALELSPGSVAARRGLLMISLARRRYPEALEMARRLQKEHPNDAIGWQLQSDVHAVQRDWPAAIASMREAIKRAPSPEAATRLIKLFASADKMADADAFVAAWNKDHPGDVAVVFQLASTHMLRRDYARAEARFRDFLAIRPDDATVLNNVAWLMVQQNKPGAVALAERALKLVPEQAQAMDTLAQALAAEGNPDKAIEWQRKAMAQAPQEPVYRLGLARLLLKHGDKAQAREELDKLSKLGSSFNGQAEVSELLKKL